MFTENSMFNCLLCWMYCFFVLLRVVFDWSDLCWFGVGYFYHRSFGGTGYPFSGNPLRKILLTNVPSF